MSSLACIPVLPNVALWSRQKASCPHRAELDLYLLRGLGMGLSVESAGVFSEPGSNGEQTGAFDASKRLTAAETVGSFHSNDMLREVYCILGLPIDAIEMPSVLSSIEFAASRRAPFVLSTPNLNFLVSAMSHPEFRESILLSDLCPPDGMPIVWIARLTGIPIRRRVAGSEIFEALMSQRSSTRQLKAYLFGGADGVAANAANAINDKRLGMQCVGSMSPGYGSIEELSRNNIIDEINASDADFLMVSLGALKGQLWLYRNRLRLGIPVRAHLGAVINFQANIIKRAPACLRSLGLEWLWRIKEEPRLWSRYLNDGLVFIRLLVTQILPLAIWSLWRRWQRWDQADLRILLATIDQSVVEVKFVGAATARHVDKAVSCLQEVSETKREVVVDVSLTQFIDGRFFGLLLMLRKQLFKHGGRLKFSGVSPGVEKMFRLNGVNFLLTNGGGA
jgi:N-acetylglucosaminyldiphosphoundecaprenol N-acetyl-beta-D-mannosaminyltransferase